MGVQRHAKATSSLVQGSGVVGRREWVVRPTLVLRMLLGIGVVIREMARLPAYAAEAERLHREIRRSGDPRRPRVGAEIGHGAIDGRQRPFGSGRTEPSV
jgi:hypothetical protein